MATKQYTDQRGNVLWRASITVTSKLDRKLKVHKKEGGFTTERQALDAVKKLRDRALRELAEKEKSGKTWKELVDGWETALLQGDYVSRRLTAGTVQDYVGPVRKYTEDWMRRPCAAIQKVDVRRLINEISATVSPIRASKLKGFLAIAFRWALDNGFDANLRDNPVHGVSVVNLIRRNKRPDILTGEEIRRLLECAKALGSAWYPVWAMAVMTGMRSGELYALLWTDVDFNSGLISVTKSFSKRAMVMERNRFPDGIKGTKTESWRHIPISPDLRAFLVELGEQTGGTGHVLPRIKAWGNNGQAEQLKAFCESIGLKPVVFHALRACFAVQLLQSGVPMVTVQAIGGWEDLKTMQKYVRMAGVDIAGATSNLNLLPPREAIAKVFQLNGARPGNT